MSRTRITKSADSSQLNSRAKRDMLLSIALGMTPWEGHMAIHIGRRELIATLAGMAAWPLAARAAERDAARWHAPFCNCRLCSVSGMGRGVRAGAGSIGLAHRPQRADRDPLGHRRSG